MTHLASLRKDSSSDQAQPLSRRHQFRLYLLAAILGVFSFGVAAFLINCIRFFTHLLYHQKFSLQEATTIEHSISFLAIFIPVIGGIITGLMAKFGSMAIRGHGIPEAMEQILKNESKIPYRILFLKPISSAIVIGSGGPFGAEGPIISTGGALGSLLGQVFKLSSFEKKVLLACGAAGGMTAIFDTPLASILLTIELLLFEFRAESFIPVSISAVIAASTRGFFWPDVPFFTMTDFQTIKTSHVPIYLFSGVVFGIIATFITKSVYFVEDLYEKLPVHWMWWPAIGGFFVGIIGFIEPLSLGVGYSNIEMGLNASLGLKAALLLCLWKFLSWNIALSSGTSGGTLAPLLTFGSLLGLSLGILLSSLFPHLNIDLQVMALIGMASIFVGCSHAFFASIVFALETTRHPLGLIPIVGACSLSYLVSHWIMKTSIMTEKLERRGIRVPTDYYPNTKG